MYEITQEREFHKKLYFETLDQALDFIQENHVKYYKIKPKKRCLSSIT